MTGLSQTSAGTWFDSADWDRLQRRMLSALQIARHAGAPHLVSFSVQAPLGVDPTAIVVESRRGDDPWFCFEQPDHGGAAVAGLGAVRELEAQGPGRFADLSRAWQNISGDAVADPPAAVPGSGLVAVGGFAFAPSGGGSPRWNGFPAASLTIPEISLARRDGEAWLTLNLDCAPDDRLEGLLAHAERRLFSLRAGVLPLLDPAPSGRYEVVSAMPPAHYEQAVARGVQRIRAGELEKVVLAREVEVHAPRAHDAAAVIGLLREAFRSCYVFAVGRGDATFLAASPELLIRREGQRASTVALAGSIRRSADPAVDDHLGEQLLASAKDREENEIVARRIAQILRPHSVWVSAAEPGLVRVANIQHLGAPIRAQLRSPIDVVRLAGMLHPTPAVGGEPSGVALDLIPALEGMDRGWYAGPVGWTDSMGDGEFCVALRCALLRGALATCYAGAGIVRDSDPAAELAETEVKLQALLPLLAA
jgi:salicylate biosynthesis isochorismate synthase/menaquinone-specific isochorismate synthase